MQVPPIYPVFIPYAGCPVRCVFCAQDVQTGVSLRPAEDLAQSIEEFFATSAGGRIFDLAYYGGTFTSLPLRTQDLFLSLGNRLKQAGLVRQVRCSTRPDAITPVLLEKLHGAGLDFIELGIQSFCDEPLRESRRNYGGAVARAACEMVLSSKIGLGVQLLPGMPGMREEHFAADVEACARLGPQTVRLYPCMVIKGTLLAAKWSEGNYSPWSLEAVLRLLPDSLLRFWEKGISVIRMGLAPEKSLDENTLAGPRHPALGQCLRSRATYLYLEKHLKPSAGSLADNVLYAPRHIQGEFFGHKGELKQLYADWGITTKNVRWWPDNYFELR